MAWSVDQNIQQWKITENNMGESNLPWQTPACIWKKDESALAHRTAETQHWNQLSIILIEVFWDMSVH